MDKDRASALCLFSSEKGCSRGYMPYFCIYDRVSLASGMLLHRYLANHYVRLTLSRYQYGNTVPFVKIT